MNYLKDKKYTNNIIDCGNIEKLVASDNIHESWTMDFFMRIWESCILFYCEHRRDERVWICFEGRKKHAYAF